MGDRFGAGRRLLLAVGAVACGAPIDAEEGPPACDGRLQYSEGEVVDQPFDEDRDGYVDLEDPGCAATYGAWFLDCDDGDPFRHPEAVEIACNRVDDDCNPDTADALDHDGDGTISCDDCDDTDATRSPSAREICWDAIDNDCDGEIDPGCGPNYNGAFELDRPVQYACLDQIVTIDFSFVSVIWLPPEASLLTQGSPTPGTMNGTIQPSGTFVFSVDAPILSGYCEAEFQWVGAFADVDHFTGDFSAHYSGVLCGGCDDHVWVGVSGTRLLY